MPTLVGILPVDQGRRLPRQWAACVVVDANLGWHAVRRPRSTPTQQWSPSVRARHVLVDQDHIPIRIGQLQVAGTLALGVGTYCQLDALGVQLGLEFTYVLEVGQFLLVLVPAGIESQQVALEHALEQSDHRAVAAQHQPVLCRVTTGDREAQRFIERTGGGQVLHREADRERAELHEEAPGEDGVVAGTAA
ncbi:hypothetical protein G6F68_012188 [Rhizopus microsporus]|nr:hypothetical protein G6F68_012188 [Rhizopus microsporus]